MFRRAESPRDLSDTGKHEGWGGSDIATLGVGEHVRVSQKRVLMNQRAEAASAAWKCRRSARVVACVVAFRFRVVQGNEGVKGFRVLRF